MAPSALEDDVAAVLDEIKAPKGIVLPPKEIKGMHATPTHGTPY